MITILYIKPFDRKDLPLIDSHMGNGENNNNYLISSGNIERSTQ
jgi:hypothetical protein